MTDFQSAVDKAIYDRLEAIITDVPIYQHVPEDTPPPVVIIGDTTFDDEADKEGSLFRFEVSIVCVVQGPGRKPLNALQARVWQALNDWRPAPTAEVQFGDIRIGATSGQEIQATQGPVYYGQQSAILYVQAA